jgi:2-oxoglutarate dehydrogenase E2 component (dihydrolipoamide succinyltransferase)
MIKILMPEMGERVKSAVLTKWHKSVGEVVQEGEILFEISTDKVESEIPSSVTGKIQSVSCEEGDDIAVGTVLAIVE